MRDLELYRAEGSAGFFKTIKRGGPRVITEDIKPEIERLLAQGSSLKEVADELEIGYEALRKAVQRGKINHIKKKVNEQADSLGSTHKSQRNQEDCVAPIGMGATNIEGRIASSLLKGGPASPEFKQSVDIVNGGVMLAIPALLHCGLLNHIDKHFKLPDGYYDVSSVILTLAFSALARISSIEQLRYEPPGEWGKLLGLDRIPEVKTLREKVDLIARDNKAKEWSVELCKDWLQTLPEGAAALYVDGHVRVYSGEQFNIPKHFVPRIKLCLHAACDYWVNAMDGQPFFMVSQPVDPGLIKTIENEIVPVLENTVPNQPSEKILKENPKMSRFTIVFDREGYSPDFIMRLWKKRIAIKTYAKYPGEDWPVAEFTEYRAKLPGGEETTLNLAERGLKLISKTIKHKKEDGKDAEATGEKDEEEQFIWVREIRKLNKDNSQTIIYTTEFHTTTVQAAIGMFARWCQENFFKYMRKHYGIDDLIAYSAQECPDNVRVVNPAYRGIDGKIRRLKSTHDRRVLKLRSLEIPNIDAEKMEKILKKKDALREEIETMEKEIAQLKEERKKIAKHILAKDLSAEDKIKFLTNPSKQLVDMIKIVCYRAETAMALTLREKMSRSDDARSLLQGIYKNEADLIPDNEKKTLTVRLHHLANHASSESLQHLCDELNKTETVFPGTDLRLIYVVNN